MTTFYDEVQELKQRYPDPRSAALPALRLAQEKHGYLSTDALRECAEALDTTPAYCAAVASFYDMFHHAPVGRHLVEVCTNVSCALVGARQVLEHLPADAANRLAPLGLRRRRPAAAAHVRFRDPPLRPRAGDLLEIDPAI